MDYALKVLARKQQRRRFMHKTKYGRELDQTWGYDKKAHHEEYLRTKDLPFDPLIHLK